MLPNVSQNSADFSPEHPLAGGESYEFRTSEPSAVAAQPFWGRFFRAVTLVGFAVMAHLWVEYAPRDAVLTMVDAGGLSQANAAPLAAELSGGLRPIVDTAERNPSPQASTDNASAPQARVQVLTRLLPVSSIGYSPAEPPAERRASIAEPKAVATTGMTSVPRQERPIAAAMREEPADRVAAAAEDSVVGQTLAPRDQASDPLSDPPTPLIPLAAAQRALPTASRRISVPVNNSGTPTKERVIALSPIVEPDQKQLVNRVLEQYAAAYERLDVAAAKAVYPAIDDAALKKAFGQLEAQRVTFQSCGITISGRDANARCQGEAAYQPRIGSRALHRAPREWTFDLAKADDGWQIVKATVR